MTASAKAVVERLTEEVGNRGDLDVLYSQAAVGVGAD